MFFGLLSVGVSLFSSDEEQPIELIIRIVQINKLNFIGLEKVQQ